uniref:cyclic nucleotide-gated ion channel 1-like n=1 Tax=Fragaria vesca subsp. vesca TaxID=101020 RepID=UPI0005C87B8E|nr:PREDICTED: cyclic nucleotide-gated ion channel 1-like [Fragaria vesca subsp. vesca]XP_011470215.1 PREDICTED: cyclic nucleotide-gated ion channel 1-like [Fragaria vesca subsp. vesca]
MAKHQGPNNEIQMSITPDVSHDFGSPEAHRKPTPEHGQPQASSQRWNWPTVAGVSSDLNPWWNKILVTSCVIAVLFDPLFFYIPYTSEEKKCMGSDERVQTAALIFRSVTDITFLVHIIYQLYVAIKFALSRVDESLVFRYESVSRVQMIRFAKAFSLKLSWRSFLTDVFAILPIPQLLIVGLFFNIGGNDYLLRRKIVSGFLLVQYVPRIYRIYLSSVAITESALWVRGVFNLFLYILASHALGAFWYFFSIQRQTSCWHRTCIADLNRTESECTFYCDDSTAALITGTPQFNTTLDEQCVLKVPYNMTDPPFDFGIFFDALKNDIQGKINVPQKIGYCFWWGLRNLSNFGTSLTTSTYLWENSFAILISIIGLLLFLYLIGNVQIYMERATTRADEVREKLRIKKNDIDDWIENNGIGKDMKEEIMKNIKEKLEKDISADLDDIYSILPPNTRKVVKRFVGMRTLRNVPMLSEVDGRVLKMMCDYLKPVKYQENTMVFKMGKPFDRMVFITDGSMWTYTTATDHQTSDSGKATSGGLVTSSSTEAHFLEKGDAYGHMLLQLASSSFTTLPISDANVKCHTKVEAFVLMASDLRNIVTECGRCGRCGDLWPDFKYNASQDEEAVQKAPPGHFQQQQGPKKRGTTSNIHPTGYSG